MKQTDNALFLYIYAMLKILCTVPMTSCECERCVCSSLRSLKTYMRTSVGQERLNGLALLHVHYTLVLKKCMVARKHARRLTLVGIFNSLVIIDSFDF